MQNSSAVRILAFVFSSAVHNDDSRILSRSANFEQGFGRRFRVYYDSYPDALSITCWDAKENKNHCWSADVSGDKNFRLLLPQTFAVAAKSFCPAELESYCNFRTFLGFLKESSLQYFLILGPDRIHVFTIQVCNLAGAIELLIQTDLPFVLFTLNKVPTVSNTTIARLKGLSFSGLSEDKP